ncbi:transcriptional regulator, TraR/DksA family [Malonomonas rubra DSM 5091]|uniref:Transcriptional regulator, TraR/DksA family n=1 Tax=Malonomonas rubra DSM 5091 TaxID=1122189 RepID=A0A1M6HG16_MALRU|nr:TraR/DksA family transcriptional regulator [Malonomonas rubra]SHJ21137.1 transcriptional regulator, TraR/DksA family [Malonomonas rubra DSM 5091]
MDDLTAEQADELQQALHELRAELLQLLDDSADSSKAVELDQPIGRLSRMDALQQQAMAKASRNGVQRRLQLIDSALAAIKQGRYGECRRCEEPIGYPRLQARPESLFCLECQGRIEEES